MSAPYRRLGRIVKAHGTTGEVTVTQTGGRALVLPLDEDVWIVPPPASGAVPRRIESVRSVPSGGLVRFSGVETAAEAHDLCGRWLLARGEESRPQEGPDVYLGAAVRDVERGDLGHVTDVIVTGANDVIVVEGERYGQVLIPVIDGVILGFDGDGITVALLDGLIDEDD